MKEVNDETILLKKKPNKITIALVVVGILMIVGIIGGLSYALWTYTASQGTVNKVTSDCIEVTITDETDVISLANAYPLTDEQAKSLSPYTFKVTNKCNTEIVFDVNLEIMDVTSRLSSDFVAVSFNEGEKSILGNNINVDPTYNKSDYTAVEAYNLGNDKLAGGKSKSYTLRLWMDESVTIEDDVMNKKFISKINITATTLSPICKRATELHTETCSNSNTSYYCQADGYANGDTITYGNLGTKGTLTTGDAFDCDVNGDGIYNSDNERFYYVTDMNASTSVLVYYNNVSGGVVSNSTTYAYDTSGTNSNGPVTAKEQLPATTQWKNVKLTNTLRNITDETGIVKTSNFSYEGYAARLLTYQEVNAGCFDGRTAVKDFGGLSAKCKFLVENTKYSNDSMGSYGAWLETPDSSRSSFAWSAYGSSRRVDNNGVSTVNSTSSNGVRPVIEVAKSRIDY